MGRREDDQLIREMLAPEVETSLDALAYWLRRYEQLPFYRRGARAEARRMIDYWQSRAVSDATRSPIRALLNARAAVAVSGQLIAHRTQFVVRRSAVTLGAFSALVIALLLR